MGNNLVRLSLKVWNSAMGVGGIATIMYAILMFRVSQVGGAQTSPSHHMTIPWFFHGFLFVGIVLCAVTLLGHLAANTANNCCLSTVSIQTLVHFLIYFRYSILCYISVKNLTQAQYIVVILLLLILETVIMTVAFLDPKWEKELPLSTHIWKCLASLVFLIQAICVLLAALSIHETNGVDGHESEYEDALLDTVARWQQDGRRIAIL